MIERLFAEEKQEKGHLKKALQLKQQMAP